MKSIYCTWKEKTKWKKKSGVQINTSRFTEMGFERPITRFACHGSRRMLAFLVARCSRLLFKTMTSLGGARSLAPSISNYVKRKLVCKVSAAFCCIPQSAAFELHSICVL